MWLNKKTIKKLRSQVVLNSLFYDDYTNTLGIDKHKVFNFFEGYLEHLCDIAEEDNYVGDTLDIIRNYDNTNELYNYYIYLGFNPFE